MLGVLFIKNPIMYQLSVKKYVLICCLAIVTSYVNCDFLLLTDSLDDQILNRRIGCTAACMMNNLTSVCINNNLENNSNLYMNL